MFGFGAQLSHLERHVSNFTIEALADVLEPAWIDEALAAAGRASRRVRALPADLMVWVLVGMGLWRDMGIRKVLAELRVGLRRALRWRDGQPPASNAITKARDRLGAEVPRHLVLRVADAVRTQFAPLDTWRGLALAAIDGTTLRMSDSPRNRAHYGAPGSSRGRSAFPQLRLVALMSAVTHMVLAFTTGPCRSGEAPMAKSLLSQLKAGTLLLLDRGFLDYGLLFDVRARDSHFVARAKRRLHLRRRKGLGSRDYLADAVLPRLLRAQRPDLPERMRVRVVSYQVPGFPPVRLLTSLLDPNLYPAHEIVARYRDRWEIELGYDEIKTHLADARIPMRSATPERVLQEVHGLLLAYNAVRALMARTAAAAGVEPRRLSFTDVLARVRQAVTVMALTPGTLLPKAYELLLEDLGRCRLPPRRDRHYPREVKAKMSSYPLNRRIRAA